MTTQTATLAALRAILPLATEHADTLRHNARMACVAAGGDKAHEWSVSAVRLAEAATSAVTAARLALQDAEAAAHHISCHVRYAVSFQFVRPCGSRAAAFGHTVEVMAECADDAQAAAIAACEAANLVPGDVLRVERVTA